MAGTNSSARTAPEVVEVTGARACFFGNGQEECWQIGEPTTCTVVVR
ncbi:hypothetical protein [Arachnia propionica]|nr:hypothetical protein [Arachnia propionica]